jgi:hypothetical protein
VAVAVMKVRHMSVTVYERLVPVPMSVRFSRWIGRQVLMLMVFIVTMRMFVFQSFMQMIVLVVLGQMHPYPKNH